MYSGVVSGVINYGDWNGVLGCVGVEENCFGVIDVGGWCV